MGNIAPPSWVSPSWILLVCYWPSHIFLPSKLVQPRLFWGFYKYHRALNVSHLHPPWPYEQPQLLFSGFLSSSECRTLNFPNLLIFNVATTDTTLTSGINPFVVNRDHINVKHRGYVVTRGLSDVANLQHPLVSSPVLASQTHNPKLYSSMITRVSLRNGDRDYEQCRNLLLTVMDTATKMPTKLVTTCPRPTTADFRISINWYLSDPCGEGPGFYLSCCTNWGLDSRFHVITPLDCATSGAM